MFLLFSQKTNKHILDLFLEVLEDAVASSIVPLFFLHFFLFLLISIGVLLQLCDKSKRNQVLNLDFEWMNFEIYLQLSKSFFQKQSPKKQ
jgi:hypothetical protein